jgi:hypothetical protein
VLVLQNATSGLAWIIHLKKGGIDFLQIVIQPIFSTLKK